MFPALSPIIYVQISPERLTLKNLKTGESISEVPELAISSPPRPKILAVGPQARAAAASHAADVVNPFAHPRSLVSDFTVAEQLLKHQMRRVLGRSLLTFAPYVVLHPLGAPAGGFTQVERRAFREMALGAGASQVRVWTGRPLTEEELLSRQPPASGGEWE
ncbi:MAG TPA: rod shape-determining protein [Roseateles sp.]|uniref:rod shape-determining protein n=1 Tax=Roseateles sp. TaxID=1971397 RepID=UPI002ED924CE